MRIQCFSTIPLFSPPKIQGQTNLASNGCCHQFWVTVWLLASPLVLSPFADSLCSPFSDCCTLCPHPSPPDSAALKPWTCLWTMFLDLAIPAPHQVSAHPWNDPCRQRNEMLWFTRLRSRLSLWLKGKLTQPRVYGRERERGIHVKEKLCSTLVLKERWRHSGREWGETSVMCLCKQLLLTERLSFPCHCGESLLIFQDQVLKKPFTELPEIPTWLLYYLSTETYICYRSCNVQPISSTNTYSTPIKVQSAVTLTSTKKLEYQALCAHGKAC